MPTLDLLTSIFMLALGCTALAVLNAVMLHYARRPAPIAPTTWSIPYPHPVTRDNSPEAMIARVLASLDADEHGIERIDDVWPGKWHHGVCTCGHRVASAGSVFQAAAYIDAHARAKRQPRDAKGRFVKATVIDARTLATT